MSSRGAAKFDFLNSTATTYDRHAATRRARLGIQSERPLERGIAHTGMPLHQRDYFAELYVAGLMGDNGWNVYFPKRDIGFDFIATKSIEGSVLIRPVQVKGLYPSEAKKTRLGTGISERFRRFTMRWSWCCPISRRTEPGLRRFALRSCLALRFALSLAGGISVFPPNLLREEPSHEKRFGSSLALTVCAIWNFFNWGK